MHGNYHFSINGTSWNSCTKLSITLTEGHLINFCQQNGVYGGSELGDCKLTRGQIYFIEVCNTPHIVICGQSWYGHCHLHLDGDSQAHIRISSSQTGCQCATHIFECWHVDAHLSFELPRVERSRQILIEKSGPVQSHVIYEPTTFVVATRELVASLATPLSRNIVDATEIRANFLAPLIGFPRWSTTSIEGQAKLWACAPLDPCSEAAVGKKN